MKCYIVAAVWMVLACVSARAENLLSNGEFEPVGGEVAGWLLDEFASGTGESVNSASLAGFAAISGKQGLWLRAFAGGSTPGPNNLTNAVLSQTVSGVAGETYTFLGSSRWEGNYSGAVIPPDVLAPNSPLPGQESPTVTEMELAFLDAGGSVLGTPVTLDLQTEQDGFGFDVEHMLVGQAPAGTASVRVTAAARDMVFNTDPAQSAFYDAFSLTAAAAPSTQLLANADLEAPAPSGLDGWTIFNDDPENPDNMDVVRAVGFANHTPGGQTGIWLSSFFGQAGTEVDGTFSQTVPGVAGGDYQLTGWSRWEANYSGGLSEAITETFMEIAFLDSNDDVIGDPLMLDLRDVQMSDGEWRQHELAGAAPEGTENIRVTAGMLDGFNSDADPQSAFFDDFVLELLTDLAGDFDKDGNVDGDDFLLWQANFGTSSGATQGQGDADGDGDVDGDDFLLWQANFPTISDGGGSAAVPEPAGLALLVLLSVLTVLPRRYWS